MTRSDGLAPRIERELRHPPRRPAVRRIVRRKHDRVDENPAASRLVQDDIEIDAAPRVLTIGQHDDHFAVGAVPGSFRVLLPANRDEYRFV